MRRFGGRRATCATHTHNAAACRRGGRRSVSSFNVIKLRLRAAGQLCVCAAPWQAAEPAVNRRNKATAALGRATQNRRATCGAASSARQDGAQVAFTRHSMPETPLKIHYSKKPARCPFSCFALSEQQQATQFGLRRDESELVVGVLVKRHEVAQPDSCRQVLACQRCAKKQRL